MRRIFQIGPIFLTGILIIWSLIVAPYSKYGDNWTVYPILIIFLLGAIWHILLIVIEKNKFTYFLYGLANGIILFVIFMICLMKVSKDSL